MHVFSDLAAGPHLVFEDSCMDEEGVREHWHSDEVEQRRSKHQLIEPRFLLHQPSLRQNPTRRHFTNTTCIADIDVGLTDNLHTHLLDGLDVKWALASATSEPPSNKLKLRETWRSFQTSIPNCPPLIVCKSACSPPEIFVGRTRGIRSSRCSFLVGNTPSFRKISFSRQRAACTTRTSKSCKLLVERTRMRRFLWQIEERLQSG